MISFINSPLIVLLSKTLVEMLSISVAQCFLIMNFCVCVTGGACAAAAGGGGRPG